jgi:dolichol-phosphate mannosyltransferase
LDQIFHAAQDAKNWDIEVLVVDSSSPDKTAGIVRDLQKKYQKKLHLLETPKEGLGKAYVKGFTYAIETLHAYCLFEMDADLQHQPKEIPHFLKQIEEGADFVIGSRYIPGGSIPKNWGLSRKLFSIFGNLFVRLGFMKLAVTDWTDGYRCIKSWVVKNAMTHVKPYTGYVFQIALLDYAIKDHAVVREIPVQFQERNDGESKISSGRYMYDIVWYVFQHSAFIKFVIVGFIGFAVDFGFASLFIYLVHINKAVANMASAEVAIISNFFLNNFWSFKHKRIVGSWIQYVFNFLKFNTLSVGSILLQGLGMFVMLKFLGDHIVTLGPLNVGSWVIYKVAIIAFVIIPYSYILYNKFIWKEKK